MSKPQSVDAATLSAWLSTNPAWQERSGQLFSAWQFVDFGAAFECMAIIAEAAESLGHHPDWRNVYNRLEVRLWTHDCGAITSLDLALAVAVQEAATTAGAKPES